MTSLKAALSTVVSLTTLLLAFSLVPLRAFAQNDPIERDGKAMIAAIHNDDVRRMKILLDRGYIHPDGFTDKRGYETYFLWEAGRKSKFKALHMLLDAGATRLPEFCEVDVYNGPISFSGVGATSIEVTHKAMEHLIEKKVVDLKVRKYHSPTVECWQRSPLAKVFPIEKVKGTNQHEFTDAARRYWRFLVQNGLDLTASDPQGWNALHWNVWGATDGRLAIRLAMIEELRLSGFDFNATSKNGIRPIDAVALAPDLISRPYKPRCAPSTSHMASKEKIRNALRAAGSVEPQNLPTSCPRKDPYCIPC